jgi:carboxypeptidase family protein
LRLAADGRPDEGGALGSIRRLLVAAFGLGALVVVACLLLELKRSGYRFEDYTPDTICGRVVDSRGWGIPGATVWASPIHERWVSICSAISDSTGTYHLAGLQRKTYALLAKAPGYSPAENPEVVVPQRRVELMLEAGRSFEGLVVGPNGSPLQGAEVRAFRDSQALGIFFSDELLGSPPLEVVKSGGDGKVTFQCLGEGSYSFLATAPGLLESRISAFKVTKSSRSRLRLVLSPGLMITGTVLSAAGEPVAGARIRATSSSHNDSWWSASNEPVPVTDERGEFSIDALKPVTYDIIASHPDHPAARLQWIKAGGKPIMIVLADGIEITGSVTEAGTGRAIARAAISLTDPVGSNKEGLTGSEGAYSFKGLNASSGPHSMSIRMGGYSPIEDAVVQVTGQGPTIRRDFVLEPTARVRGRVVDRAGKPIRGAKLRLNRLEASPRDSDNFATDVSDEDGRFWMAEIKAGDGVMLTGSAAGFIASQGPAFSLRPGEALTIPDFVLEREAIPRAMIRGVVRDQDRRPIRGAVVRVLEIGSQGMRELETVSGPRGVFRLEGLPAQGTVEVTVSCPGFLDFSDERVPVNASNLQVALKWRGDR